MNERASRAGAQIGDILWEIGAVNVAGISANDIGQFFIGPMNAEGKPSEDFD